MGTRLSILMAMGTLACTALPTDTGFPLAYLHDDCAPWDGAALTLLLSQHEIDDRLGVGYPHLRITSWRPPSSLAGGSFSWEGNAGSDGYATLCDSSESCVSARRVRVDFDRAQGSGDVLTGRVHVQLEEGRVVEGPFAARRLEYPVLCG